MNRLFFLTCVFILPIIVFGQAPTALFNLPITACTSELILTANLSSNSTSYEWDFCIGNFNTSPIIEDDILSSSSSLISSLKIIYDGANYHGFATALSTNELYRLDFGSSISNVPVLTNLGTLGDILDSPEGIDIIKINNEWIGFVGYGVNGGHMTRLTWGSLTEVPVAENIGNFGFLGRIRDVQIANQNNNYILVFPYYNEPKLVRVDFGNSLLNTPIEPNDVYTSNSITDVSLARGISVLEINNEFKVILVSETNGAINYLDLGSDLLSEPNIVNTYFFSDIIRPLRIKIIREGYNYFALISNDRSNVQTALIDLKTLNSSDIPELLDLYSSKYYGVEAIKVHSSSYFFGTNTNLSKLFFSNECSITPSYSEDFEPTFLNDSSDIFEVDLSVYNDQRESDFITKSITISPSLAPVISTQITGNCLSTSISFDGQQISGDIANWNWDFGDGSGTSALQNDSYTFAASGTYQVKLTVTDVNGCNNLLIDTVQVYEEPMPNFTGPGGSLCMNNTILFTNTSTGETGPVVNWTWDFNGEGSSAEKEPTFTFLTAGNKTITLTSSIPGCANVTQQTIAIEEAPTTAFTFNNTCNTQITTFTDLTTGNNLTTWNWDFGDSNNSTDQSPIHTYATPGKYVVTLSVSNSLGCTTTKVDTVYNHSIPVVDFTNDLPCSTSPIQFTDQSLVANANLVAWEWDFGDGTTSDNQHPQHLYDQIGDFTVKLKAYSQFGCVDSLQTMITVAQGPQVDFEWDKACEGEATTFTDLTNSFGVSITNWNWIVDGTLLTNQHPTYTFTNSGTYTVQLSVTVNNLCAQTMSQDIIVEVPPTVQFDYTEGCGGSGTTFYDLTAQTNDPIIAREWRVDGSIFSTDTIAPILLDPGNYAITLSVITNAGCEETTTSNVSLIGSPVADFTVNTNYGASPLQVDFSNLSTGGSTYHWNFGDAENTTSEEQNPTFTFNAIGLYTVTLRTSSDPNCYDESSQQIEVVEPNSNAEIMAITPITTNNITNFVVTLENSGTSLIDNSSSLIFRADYGAEVIEPVNTLIYAGKTINYSATYAIPSNSSTSSICVELIDAESTQLDRSCVNINGSIHISEPYPNPTKGLITIDVLLESVTPIKIRVVNRSGQPVLIKSFDGTMGLNNLLIDAQGLPQGLYIIEVNSGGKTEQFKTSIVR